MMLSMQAQSASDSLRGTGGAVTAATCSLTQQELARYPGSLLSSIASDCSDDSSSSSSNGVNIDLNEVPGWPSELVKQTEAAAVITAMYRTGHFPLEWLQQQLTVPGSSDSAVYHTLQQLLSFLNLPGTVLGWLPLADMTVRHTKALRFHRKAAAVLAVDDMLSFSPLLSGSSTSSTPFCAAFLVTTTGEDGSPLLVHALKLTAADKLACTVSSVLQTKSSTLPAAGSSTLHDYGTDAVNYIAEVKTLGARLGSEAAERPAADIASGAADSREWAPPPWAVRPREVISTVVSATHYVFGVPLQAAALEAASSLGLSVGTARIGSADAAYDIWVLSW